MKHIFERACLRQLSYNLRPKFHAIQKGMFFALLSSTNLVLNINPIAAVNTVRA